MSGNNTEKGIYCISSVQKQKRSSLYDVYDDNGKLLISCTPEIRARFALFENSQITHISLKEARRENQRVIAKEAAMSCLSRRNYSNAGLIKKLEDKGISKTHAKDAADAMQTLGYVNDESYAKELCEYYYSSKLYGIYRVKAELLKRGIDKALADETAERYDIDPILRAMEFLRRGYKNILFSDNREVKRIFDRLVRNGYSFSDARAALKHIGNDEMPEIYDDIY